MTISTPFRMNRLCRLACSGAVSLALLCGVISRAAADDSWQEAGSGAVAILPVPSRAAGITSGSLVCAEQRWSLRLRTETEQAHQAAMAKVTIDGESFPVIADRAPGLLTLPVSYEMIEGLKAGGELVVGVAADAGATHATFPLRGSRTVIESIAPRCSQVDMSAFDQIVVSETDPAVETALPLLEGEMKLFRAATSAKPKIAAIRLDRGEGREMLFATVCGSSWYYGRTGCSLFGYLRPAATQAWMPVYNTEGMAIYIDPNASKDGWPDLVTLEPTGAYEPMHWKWNGTVYAVGDPQIATEELRGSTITP